MTDEEKNSIELDIEAKYVGRKEKEFLNNITYAECLYILDTKNNYCDDIKNLSLLKIVDIIEKQSKEIEEYKECERLSKRQLEKQKNDIESLEIEIEELKEDSCCMTNCVKRDKEKIFLEDKIKAKIEELDKAYEDSKNEDGESEYYYPNYTVEVLQSLLEEE